MFLFPDHIHSSWELMLHPDLICKIQNIEEELEKNNKKDGYKYFPEKENVIRFLSLDLSKIKCVIVGMEPYASVYTDINGMIRPVATGRSFEVANVNDWQQKFKQSSLRNILKTVYYNKYGYDISMKQLRNEVLSGSFSVSQPHEWFRRLEQQGVLFLNASLTVAPYKPNSHTELWKTVMDTIIRFIDDSVDVKWLLFGNLAQERIISVIGNSNNLYKCCHPRLPAFVGENIFQHVPEIEWIC